MSATFPNNDANTAPEQIIKAIDAELEGFNETWKLYRVRTLQDRRQIAINRIALRKANGG